MLSEDDMNLMGVYPWGNGADAVATRFEDLPPEVATEPAQYDSNGNCRACGATEGGTHAPWCERRDGTPTFTPAQVLQYRERRALGDFDALETTLLSPLWAALRPDFGDVATYGNTADGFWVEMAAGDVLTFHTTADGLVVLARPILRGKAALSVVRGH